MGQMRLNDVVGEIVGEVIAGRAINKRQAAVNRWDDIDADGQYLAGIDGVVARIDTRARRLKLKAEQSSVTEQAVLPFQLPAAVAMAIDGTTLVATRKLSRAEFARAIEIRHQQIANDQHALREWRNALRQADQFWAANPDWSFGDCLDAILAKGGTSLGGEAVQ
jgi:RNase P/RNase MRP subunit p29